MNEIDSLKASVSDLIRQFSSRVDGMKGRREYSLLIRRLDPSIAIEQASRFFGNGEFTAVGVDGSMDQAETLEMLLFYVNAIAYSAPFRVNDKSFTFYSSKLKKEDAIGASSAVPLWLEDLGAVADPTRDIESETELTSSIAQVSFSLMLLAELTCANKALEKDDVRLLFLDRPLSGTFHSLSRDVRYLLRSQDSALSGIDGVDKDRLLGDVYLFNAIPFGKTPPSHGSGTLHNVIWTMLHGSSLNEAVKSLALDEEAASSIKNSIIMRGRQFGLLEETVPDDFRFKKEAKGYKERLYEMSRVVTERVFSNKSHPLLVGGKWLNTRDLNTVNQILLVSLIERAKEKRALLLGITKDTSSTDVSRSVIRLVGLPSGLSPGLRHDRVMFTILSATNENFFVPPWRSVGYDSCFSTLSVNEEIVRGKKPEIRASRKFASREQLFVKFFFQTRTSERTIFRSPVFMYDRCYIEELDSGWINQIEYVERGSIQTISPYLEKDGRNEFDDLILYILASSDNPEVFESYGHNILLYMADKAAKADVKLKHGLLLGIINLKLTPMARKERLYTVIRRYRDTRSEVEAIRAESETK
jgi:hypothetical protein